MASLLFRSPHLPPAIVQFNLRFGLVVKQKRRRRMKGLGATIIWVWWCTMMLVTSLAENDAAEVESKQLGFSTVTYVFSSTNYEQFLNTLRNRVKGTNSCDLPSTERNPATDAEYVLVRLQVSSTRWVTLGIEAKNLYVWAYQVNSTAVFLKDATQTVRGRLFKGSTVRITGFEGNYRSLESAAGTTRATIPLTFDGLRGDVEAVYGKQAPTGREEAKFFLRAIQMVSEAARFRFIQKVVFRQTGDTTEFRRKLAAYENSWDEISAAIHKASPACEKITPTLVISNTDYRKEVNNVNDVREDMGILKYKETTLMHDHNAAWISYVV